MNLAFSSLSRANVFSFALFGLGVLLRLTSALWPESFWFDEMITLYFAKLPVAESFFIDNHPPTFFLLLKLWVSLVGPLDHNSEPVLRLLPFFISVLGLAAVFGGWSSWGVRIAMVLNPASIFFASEVRHHSLFELMSILFVLQASKVWMLRGKPEVNLSVFHLGDCGFGVDRKPLSWRRFDSVLSAAFPFLIPFVRKVTQGGRCFSRCDRHGFDCWLGAGTFLDTC
jgi:hypothetical protein